MSRRFLRPGKLFWKLFLGYAGITSLTLAACAFFILGYFDSFNQKFVEDHLLTDARILKSIVANQHDTLSPGQWQHLADSANQSGQEDLRITFVRADGTVLADSKADASRMASHADRAEIQEAIEHGMGKSTRWSNTIARELTYLAVRIGDRENPIGVVRLAKGKENIDARAAAGRDIIYAVVVAAAAAIVVFAFVLAAIWTLPIRHIMSIAARLSRGDLSARARVRGTDEIAQLARSLNEMRSRIRENLETIDHQRQNISAMLDQLREGVIVAGPDGCIMLANPAARQLVDPDGINPAESSSWVGRPIEQCVPQHDFQQLLLPRKSGTGGLHGPEVEKVRVELVSGSNPLVVLATASDLRLPTRKHRLHDSNEHNPPLRARILALRDISEIARTVQMKTDFAANASHELRTPLSAIRGAVETLGVMEFETEGVAARRFLAVIDRHCSRLEALVTDLLALSRLEAVGARISPAQVSMASIMGELTEKWQEAASRKKIKWICNIPENAPKVGLDPGLIELALGNLIDNAIKFTPDGGTVITTWTLKNEFLEIEVSDTGCGIPESERARVFERFYQVGQARSGTGSVGPEIRGTGLGLSIVRHAVVAMHGNVTLSSVLGEGTTMKITIPQDG